MCRTIENIIRCTTLADTSTVHDKNLITHTCNDTEIMGYHDNRHSQLLLQFLHQFQYLRLNRHIKCRCRLICNQDIRFTDKCHGDHDTLTHTTGQLMRILLHTAFRLIDADQCQHLHRARPRLFFILIRCFNRIKQVPCFNCAKQ